MIDKKYQNPLMAKSCVSEKNDLLILKRQHLGRGNPGKSFFKQNRTRGENQGPRNKGTQSDILFNHMPDVNIVSRSLNPNFLPNIKSGIKLN